MGGKLSLPPTLHSWGFWGVGSQALERGCFEKTLPSAGSPPSTPFLDLSGGKLVEQ